MPKASGRNSGQRPRPPIQSKPKPPASTEIAHIGLYFDLVAEFRLRPLRSDAELDAAIAIVERLNDRDDLDADEAEYLDALEMFAVAYEAERCPLPDSTPVEYLRQLIEDSGRTQADVAEGTGLSESTISDILSGRRAISHRSRRAFAGFFAVDPTLFA